MNGRSGIQILILLFIGILAIGITVYFLFIDKNPSPLTPQATSSRLSTEPLPTTNPNSLQFISQTLGIRFAYAKEVPSTPEFSVKILEEGNKVYVHLDNGTDPHTGQWVEVFQKDPKQTLTDAIKQKFLANYPDNDCFIRTHITYPDAVVLPQGYEIAEITFPAVTDTQAPLWENADKCPADYTTTNGISYFLMDTKHPDKFAYFSIGQYAIPAGSSNPQELWQDTFRFTQ